MIKGRRTSPDTGVGVGSFACISSDDTTGDEIGLLRWRGGGIVLSLDEDAFLSGDGERSASGIVSIDGIGGIADASGMVSDRETCVWEDHKIVGLASSSAGKIVGFAVSGPLSRSSL
jgi:hypothetical protein